MPHQGDNQTGDKHVGGGHGVRGADDILSFLGGGGGGAKPAGEVQAAVKEIILLFFFSFLLQRQHPVDKMPRYERRRVRYARLHVVQPVPVQCGRHRHRSHRVPRQRRDGDTSPVSSAGEGGCCGDGAGAKGGHVRQPDVPVANGERRRRVLRREGGPRGAVRHVAHTQPGQEAEGGRGKEKDALREEAAEDEEGGVQCDGPESREGDPLRTQDVPLL